MRKLLALFCALGMLVPSVAMATFGNTFGGRNVWADANVSFTDDTWPTSLTSFSPGPIGCFSSVGSTNNVYNCVEGGDSAAFQMFRHSIRAGDRLRRVTCLATVALGAGTGTITLAVYNADDVVDTNVEMAEMVIATTGGIAVGQHFSFDMNVAATYNGFYAIGVKTTTAGDNSSGSFGVNCTVFIGGSA